MYLKSIYLENIGIVELVDINIDLQHHNPKPLIIVGENGSGRTTIVSSIADALYEIASIGMPKDISISRDHESKGFFRNLGNTKKYGTGGSLGIYNFISGETEIVSYSRDGDIDINAKRYADSVQNIELIKADILNKPVDQGIKGVIGSYNTQIKEIFDSNACLYFPSFRFDLPGWLNADYYADGKILSRNIIDKYYKDLFVSQATKQNSEWIADILYFASVNIMNYNTVKLGSEDFYLIPVETNERIIALNSINSLIKLILNEESACFMKVALSRNPVVMSGLKIKASNISYLSNGELAMINIFMSVCRNFDAPGSKFSSLDDVTGIIIIDEIETHLHSNLQFSTLPKLIKSFPKVQFIIVTHSPLFILGLTAEIGEDGFDIFDVKEK